MVNDILEKLVADKYRVESLIREGESGDLYAARHEVLDKPVTIKILPPALAIDARWVKRFVNEARAASAVTHQNILNLTDFGTDAKGISYAVFEPAGDETLRDLMTDESPFDDRRTMDVSRQIAAAVSAAHAKNVIHGGLSPKNIFVDADGDTENVKVFGFGSDRTNVERNAEPQYLAPEQLTAFPAGDERSDVYALGVIFYEMLSGVVPFDGATAVDVVAKQNTEPPPPLSAFRRDLHPEIEPIVLTAIAADPDKRYQTMQAFAEDLEILSGRIGLPAKPDSLAAAAGAAPRRNIWQTAFIALAGIGVLAVALIYATSVRQTDPTAQLQPEAGYLPVQPIGPATGALEDNLAKQGPLSLSDAEILANSNMLLQMEMPGGDGYNAWANGGAPPPGAPPPGSVPPGGGTVIIPGDTTQIPAGVMYDAENNRCFDGGVVVRCPWEAKQPEKPAKDGSSEKPADNDNVKPTPTPANTPKPLLAPSGIPSDSQKPIVKNQNPTKKKPAL